MTNDLIEPLHFLAKIGVVFLKRVKLFLEICVLLLQFYFRCFRRRQLRLEKTRLLAERRRVW